MKLLVVSEGALDHGDTLDSKYADRRAERRALEGVSDRKGVVTVLVQRLLEEKLGREIKEWELESRSLPRINRGNPMQTGYEQKVLAAIREARILKCSAVVIVVDRDGKKPGLRFAALDAGRKLAEEEGEALAKKTALGVAIETVEAWLLSDEAALTEALGLNPPALAVPSPEKLDGDKNTETHPKTRLHSLLKQRRSEVTWPYDEIAKRVRLDVVADRCPEGFAPFAAEVKKRAG